MKAFKEYKTCNNNLNSLTRGNNYYTYSRKTQSPKEINLNPGAYYKLMVPYLFFFFFEGVGVVRGNFF